MVDWVRIRKRMKEGERKNVPVPPLVKGPILKGGTLKKKYLNMYKIKEKQLLKHRNKAYTKIKENIGEGIFVCIVPIETAAAEVEGVRIEGNVGGMVRRIKTERELQVAMMDATRSEKVLLWKGEKGTIVTFGHAPGLQLKSKGK